MMTDDNWTIDLQSLFLQIELVVAAAVDGGGAVAHTDGLCGKRETETFDLAFARRNTILQRTITFEVHGSSVHCLK